MCLRKAQNFVAVLREMAYSAGPPQVKEEGLGVKHNNAEFSF